MRAWGNMANIPNPQTLFGFLERNRSVFFLFSTKALYTQRTAESTFTFHLCNIPLQDEEEEVEPEKEVKKHRRVACHRKTLELDTDWINSKIKVIVAVPWHLHFVQGFLFVCLFVCLAVWVGIYWI